MRYRSVSLLVLATGFGLATGCGPAAAPSGPATDTAQQVLSSTQELKELLNSVSQSGILGSGIAGVRNTLDGMKASNPALAEGLLKDLERLEKAEADGRQSEVKQIAASMAGKL